MVVPVAVELEKKIELDQKQEQHEQLLMIEKKKFEEKENLQNELIENLKVQVAELQQENTDLKLEVKHLKDLVKSLQTALAIALIAALSFMLMASLFIPFKFVLLTALLIALALNHFISNFTDIVVAAAHAVYEYLGPRNVGGLIGGFLVWGWLIGNWSFYSAPPCAQIQ